MLLQVGVKVKVYESIAMEECKRRIGGKIIYCKYMYEATVDADALMLVTAWKEFRMPSWGVLKKSMNEHVIIDERNILIKRNWKITDLSTIKLDD